MNKDFKIRQETLQDFEEIYNLIKTAFETAQVKDGDEQDYAEGLRNSPKYIPQLALVAEEKGKLIGHIMLTKIQIINADKSKCEALLLAPLSVLVEYRNIGLGTMLVHHSLKLAKEMGYQSVFLCGNPDYYNRFGFETSAKFGISNVNDIPEQYALALELVPNTLKDVEGTINFF